MKLGDGTIQSGLPPGEARAAVILVHGRGGTAMGMLPLVEALNNGSSSKAISFLIPQAPGNTWYPYPFLAPIQQNEPYLSRSLAQLSSLLAHIESAGLSPGQVLFAGFSQGACLALEFAARNARRFGGLVGLSGGLIGPPDDPRDYPGSLDGTPVFLGCSDVDPHIPRWRVDETAQVLKDLGGRVSKRIYPGMGHTINDDELDVTRRMIARL